MSGLTNVARAQANEGEMMVLPASPFPNHEMENQVLAWIAAEVAAERLPFCWRQSYGRGAGFPLKTSCEPGQQYDAGLCYQNCRPGHRGIATLCYQDCPPGQRDDGLYCAKPAPYGRGAGYPLWDRGVCESQNAQGCEQSGLIIYPKCRSGYHATGCCVCSPNCAQGWEDIGVSCKKPVYGRGVGATPGCPVGQERNGLLCYPLCGRADFTGVGPVCWQNCPKDRPHDCGAGCSLTGGKCATNVLNMVVSPILAAVSLASLGSAAAASKAASAPTTGLLNVANLLKPGSVLQKAVLAYQKLKAIPFAAKKIVTMAAAGLAIKVPSTVYKSIKHYIADYTENFANYTNPKVSAMIDQQFSPEAARYVKGKWALVHLEMLEQASAFEKADIALTAVSFVDPTGLVSVVNAYKKPLCTDEASFPAITGMKNVSPVEPILIAAVNYITATNVAPASGQVAGYGDNVILNAPPYTAQPNMVEYQINALMEGKYELSIEVAAASPRPVRVLINGSVVNDNALNITTGGWTPDFQKWVHVPAEVSLRAGVNTMRIERDNVFPHIRAIRLRLITDF